MLPPTSYTRKSRRCVRAFTLIEILLVIAVIAVLASITFGVSRGIQSAQNRTRAKSEMALLAQSIEQFKMRRGDYPWTDPVIEDGGETLLKALLGWKVFKRTDGSSDFVDLTNIPTGGPDAFIDTAQFNVAGIEDANAGLPSDNTTIPEGLVFIDPWGQPYVYQYKETGAWENFGFILYSSGPDGQHLAVDSDGVITREIRNSEKNADNIYLGE